MKTSFVFCLFLCLSFFPLSAQNDWQPGQVTLTDGTVKEGLIDLRTSKSNSTICYFRASEGAKVESYQPTDLTSYRFRQGKYFIAKALPEFDLSEPVFLEFLIDGRIQVYHYQDQFDRYFIEKEGEIFELLNTEETITKGQKQFEVERKEYIGVLNTVLVEANLQERIAVTKLQAASLIELVQAYHDIVCPEEVCIIYAFVRPAIGFQIKPFIGGTFNKYVFATDLQSDFGPNWAAGLRFEVERLFLWAEKVNLFLDLSVQSSGTYTFRVKEAINVKVISDGEMFFVRENPNSISVETVEGTLDLLALRLPVGVNYQFQQGKLAPFLGLGFLNVIALRQRNAFQFPDIFEEYGQTIPTYQLGGVVQLGASYEISEALGLWFQLSYEHTTNPNTNQLLRVKSHLFGLTGGIQF